MLFVHARSRTVLSSTSYEYLYQCESGFSNFKRHARTCLIFMSCRTVVRHVICNALREYSCTSLLTRSTEYKRTESSSQLHIEPHHRTAYYSRTPVLRVFIVQYLVLRVQNKRPMMTCYLLLLTVSVSAIVNGDL
jgi:hypothetical protein